MEVHVEGRGHAAGEQFKDGEAGQGVDGVGVEPGLAGEDLLEKPVVQGQPVGKGAQEDHGIVRVRVLEAGDDEVAAEVELALEMRSVLPRASDIGNALPVGPELAVENGAVPRTEHGHDAGVIEPQHSFRLLCSNISSYQIITPGAGLSIAKAGALW